MGLFRSKPAPDDDAPTTTEDLLTSVGPGVPGRCLACGGLGYIDSIDIGHRFQIQHCKDCGQRWEYLFDADGTVVGLTQIDDAGQPVARTRVRHRSPAPPSRPAPKLPVVPRLPVDPPASDDAEGTVIDLRNPEPAAAEDDHDDEVPAGRGHMSPAEWLRHALHR